jgi:hypothetical protein
MRLEEKKIVKNLKKHWSQHVLIFKTHDPSHEPRTNPIEYKP